MSRHALTLRLPEALAERLRREAFDTRTPANTIMVDALRRELDQRDRARSFVDEIEAQNEAIRRRDGGW